MREQTPELIVALDTASLEQARRCIEALSPAVGWFKVGLELFTACGPAAVEAVRVAGGKVFLDLKLHDIPNTVAGAVRSAARMRVDLLTLHLSGGDAMAQAAADAARVTPEAPRLLGIFTLTSARPTATGGAWAKLVMETAHRAAVLGLGGLIVAVEDVPLVRSVAPPEFLTVSPGIRPVAAPPDDQARTATPAEAARAGSDFIVVGRPITRSPDPLAAAQGILREMRKELAAAPA